MVAPLDIPESEEQESCGDKLGYETPGPFEKARSRTDHFWLLSFLFYLAAWSTIIAYAFSRGDIDKWLEPTDSAGRVCGRDPGVRDKPHLVRYNEDSCEFPNCLVCVEHCPTANFTYLEDQTTEPPEERDTLEERMSRMICEPDIDLSSVASWKQLNYLVDRQLCARDYRGSNDTNGARCYEEGGETRFDDWRGKLPVFNRDLARAKYSIAGFIALGTLIALFGVLTMRWHALFFVCGSIFVSYVLIFDYVYSKFVQESSNKTLGALLSLVIFVVVLILLVLMAIYFWRQIYLACQMIRESSKAITCTISSLLVPLAVLSIYLVVLTIGLKTHLYLTTMEQPVYRVDLVGQESCMCPESLGYMQNSTCEPDVFASKCRTDRLKECVLSGCRMVDKRRMTLGALHFLNFFGIYWSYWFALGFVDAVLASAFATWYWTFNKKLLSYLSVLESFWRIVMYHLGSIALGSLIMFVCQVIRFMLNATYQILRKINGPTAESTIVNLQCIFDTMDKFFNFINQRAYVACAVHGTDFIQSGRTAFYLLKRNAEKVFVVFEYTTWLILFLTVLISCVTTRMASSYFASREDLSYRYELSLVVFVGSMLAAWMVLRIVDVAVNTVFLCFLEDDERNDGSYQKPYFMHDELTKFLYKK